jgi:YbbR domain-containing protein
MADSPLAARRSSIKRRVAAAVTDQVPLKGTAVLLAIILWFVVNAKEPQLELVPVRFTPILDSTLVLREPVPPLQAIVAGSPKELIKLSSNVALIRRQISSDSPDTVVLDLRPSDVTLPDGVDAVVRDVQPRSVTLRFESIASRRVRVNSAIDIAMRGGGGPVTTVFDPPVVEITGPRHLLQRIASVRTVRTTIPYPDSLPHLVDIDTTGFGPARVKPAQVKVEVHPRPAAPPNPSTP